MAFLLPNGLSQQKLKLIIYVIYTVICNLLHTFINKRWFLHYIYTLVFSWNEPVTRLVVGKEVMTLELMLRAINEASFKKLPVSFQIDMNKLGRIDRSF